MKRFWFCLCFLPLFVSFSEAAMPWSKSASPEKQYEKEQYQEALDGFVERQLKNPDDTGLQFNIGNAQYRLGNYEEATKAFIDVASSSDTELSWQGFYNLGNVAYQQGKLEDAIQYYRNALEQKPEDDDTQHNLEFVREELKRRMNEAQNQPPPEDNEEGDEDNQEGQEEQPSQSDQSENAEGDENDDSPEPQNEAAGEEQQQEQAEQEQQQAQEQQAETAESQEAQAAEGLTQEEAANLLQNIEEGDRNLSQKRLRVRGRVAPGGKDW